MLPARHLYRHILRAHARVLPPDLRLVGDSYVQEELRGMGKGLVTGRLTLERQGRVGAIRKGGVDFGAIYLKEKVGAAAKCIFGHVTQHISRTQSTTGTLVHWW